MAKSNVTEARTERVRLLGEGTDELEILLRTLIEASNNAPDGFDILVRGIASRCYQVNAELQDLVEGYSDKVLQSAREVLNV